MPATVHHYCTELKLLRPAIKYKSATQQKPHKARKQGPEKSIFVITIFNNPDQIDPDFFCCRKHLCMARVSFKSGIAYSATIYINSTI